MVRYIGAMKSRYLTKGGKIRFRFETDESDLKRIEELNFSMNEKEVFVDLGEGVEASEIHPDLIALSIVLLCNPFVGESLEINAPVSKHFLDRAQSVLSRYKIKSSNSKSVAQRELKTRGFPALAFSGGRRGPRGALNAAAACDTLRNICTIVLTI